MFYQSFFVAEGLQHFEVGLFAVEDAFDAAFADDVLNLSPAELVVVGDGSGLFDFCEFRKQVFPDPHPGVGIGSAEFDFEQETALEGGVEIVGEVGGGDKDAVELFHLLQDDVLHGVLHPFH